MEYENFDIEIGKRNGQGYPVTVRFRGQEEAKEFISCDTLEIIKPPLKKFPSTLSRSDGRDRGALPPDQNSIQEERQSVEEMGTVLFNALFKGKILSRYQLDKYLVGNKGKGLRVRLIIEPGEISALPWEYMYDSGSKGYLCLSGDTPLVRFPKMEIPPVVDSLRVNPPLRVLGMICSPSDLPALDVAEEKKRITDALGKLEGKVELTWLSGETWRDLQDYLGTNKGPWHVFHFIGHGGFDDENKEGYLAFTDEEALPGEKGICRRMSVSALATLLADYGDLRVVVLNACKGAQASQESVYSSTAAFLFEKGIPCVIANQFSITDKAAVELSRDFYSKVAEGYPVDQALAEARKSMSCELENSFEWGTPVLFLHSETGDLFHVNEANKKPISSNRKFSESIRALGRGKTAKYGLIGLILLFALFAFLIWGSNKKSAKEGQSLSSTQTAAVMVIEENQQQIGTQTQAAAVKATEEMQQQVGTQTLAAAVKATEDRQQAGTQTQAAAVKATEDMQQRVGTQTQAAAAEATDQAAHVSNQTATTVAKATAQAEDMVQLVQQLSADGILSDTNVTDQDIRAYYRTIEDFDGTYNKRFSYNRWEWPTGYTQADFVIRTHSTWESVSRAQKLSESGCGFVFRDTGANNHYMIYLSLDGNVYLQSYVDGNYQKYIGYGHTGEMNLKGEAEIILVAQGRHIVYYVNDEKLFDQTIDGLYIGDIGFTISTGTDKDFGTHCTMKNTEIWILIPG